MTSNHLKDIYDTVNSNNFTDELIVCSVKNTHLMDCCRNGNLDDIKKISGLTKGYVLLNNQFETNSLVFCNKNFQIIKYLVDTCKLTKEDVLKRSKWDRNILFGCSYEVMVYLVVNFFLTKEDILRQDRDGLNAFFHACFNGNANIVEFLINTFNFELKDLQFCTFHGFNSLEYIKESCHKNVASILAKNKLI